jgi:hypothetical protein
MAGTLTISTLSDGTNSTSSTNCIQGSAKAWVNFNGSTAAIRASYNVSSVTRNSTGNYNINFTNSLSDTNYSTVSSCGNIGAIVYSTINTSSPTTSSVQINTSNAYNNSIDATFVCVAVFR